jgi:hypothetical protein
MLVICKKLRQRTHTCHAIAMAHSKQVDVLGHGILLAFRIPGSLKMVYRESEILNIRKKYDKLTKI